MAWQCDSRRFIFNGINPINIKINCYEVGTRNKIAIHEDNQLLSTMGIVKEPLNGFVNFSGDAITYYPFTGWSDYDDMILQLDLDGDGEYDTDIDIRIDDLRNYTCPGNKVPMVIYGQPDPGDQSGRDQPTGIPDDDEAMVPIGIDCVNAIRIDNRLDCLNLGRVYNRDSNECQVQGLPDPFFRKNYQRFENEQEQEL